MGSNPRISGLPKNTHRLFRRALALSGAGSQSKWLSIQVRRLIREQQEKFGEDLLQVLTLEEKDILDVIASGAAELGQIIEETLQPERRVHQLLNDLIERGYLEVRKKGGKTEQARGAVIRMYFVTQKYNAK